MDEYEEYRLKHSDEQEDRGPAATKVGAESLQQSIYKKQIKAMNQKVDVFVTEETLKFNSSKKNHQDASQPAGPHPGVPK